jgi:hypothetical protein
MKEQRAKSEEPDLRERAACVLRSQGLAIGLLDGMPADVVDALAAFTTPDGQVRPSAVAGVPELLRRSSIQHPTSSI